MISVKKSSVIIMAIAIMAIVAACSKKEKTFPPPDEVLPPILDSVFLKKDSDEAQHVLAETSDSMRQLLIESAVNYYAKQDDYTEEQLAAMVASLFTAIDDNITYKIQEPTYPRENTSYVDIYVYSLDMDYFLEQCNNYINNTAPNFNTLPSDERTQISYDSFIYACQNVAVISKPHRVAAKFLFYSADGWGLQEVTDFKANLYAAYLSSK
ncbi:MAG: hypothetical protein LBM16_03075 [Clostridiales bacterium]|jgi:hypothetical protein|nr:hypothetical protein [Clostridiales bacterium]